MESSCSQSNNSALVASIGNLPQTQTKKKPELQTRIEIRHQDQTQEGGEEEDDETVVVGGKRRRKASPAWDYCTKVEKKDAKGKIIEVVGICNYCKLEMPAHSKKNGTRGLLNHLRKCEPCPFYEKVDPIQVIQPTLTNVNNVNVGGASVSHTFNQRRCELKCVMFIIKDEQPFRAIEGKGFVDLVHDLQPKFKIPNRKKIASGVWDLYLVEKEKIMNVISDRRVSITIDTWTSIQSINYMLVTAHFMDDDWKLHKRIINFTSITSHKGTDLGKCLEVCLNGWGIDKVFTITVDNASASDGAVEYMSKRLKSLGTLMLDGKYVHLRCPCHIINLIVEDGLNDLHSSIEGIRNCVKYIHSTPERLDKFRDFAILEKKDRMANIPMDVVTRWNSTYKMLEGALKYKMVFSRMTEENASFAEYFQEEIVKEGNSTKISRVGPPVEDDWEKAQAFVHFLKKFYDTTLKLSATKTSTSNLIFNEMVGLQNEIEKKMNDHSNPTLKRVAGLMKMKFDKNWGKFEEVNKLVFVANVLDPRFKLQMLKLSFRNLGRFPSEIEDILNDVKASLLILFRSYKGHDPIENQPLCDMAIGNDDEDDEDELLKQLMQERRDEQLEEISNEVDCYLADPFECPKNKGFKILDWWRANQSRYPILSKLASDIFAIPCSTVASENAFNLGKRIVDPFKTSLTPRMVEALVCTRDWLRGDDISFYKEPTEEELELYKELEEIEAMSSTVQVSPTFQLPPPPPPQPSGSICRMPQPPTRSGSASRSFSATSGDVSSSGCASSSRV